MNAKSKQEIESAVSMAMSKFLKEQMGEQAETVSTQIMESTIMVKFKGILPPAERHMVRKQEGMELIKELKVKLIEKAKPLLGTLIKNLTKAEVVDIHSSFDPATGERIEIFTLNKSFEEPVKLNKLKKGDKKWKRT